MIEVGRICMKTAGREAGKYCVVLDVLEDGIVLVTGPKAATTIKRRKCSIHHVEPTPETVKIKKNATDREVLDAYKKAGIFKKLGTKEPSSKDIEKAESAEKKRLSKTKQKAARKKEQKPKEAKKEEDKKEEKKRAEKPKEKAGAKKENPGKKPEPKKSDKKKAASKKKK